MPEENKQDETLIGLLTYDPFLSARLVEFAHLPQISTVNKKKSKEFPGATEFVHHDIPREKLLGLLDGLDILIPNTTYIVVNYGQGLVRVRALNGAPTPTTLNEQELKNVPADFRLHTHY